MEEIWKDIKGYEGEYQVSNLGNVKSLKTNRVLKQMQHNYKYVHLCQNSKKKAFTIHRLVALHFCKGYSEELVVDHIDQNKLNNIYTNLRWVTRSNNYHNVSEKVRQNRKNGSKQGAYTTSQKTNRKKRPVLVTLEGREPKKFPSMTKAGEFLGINPGDIWKILNGRKKSPQGILIEYING